MAKQNGGHAARPAWQFRVASTLVVNGVLQSLASLELRGLGGWNGNLLAGARIARNAGGTIRHRESAKADKLYLFALLQRIATVATRSPLFICTVLLV